MLATLVITILVFILSMFLIMVFIVYFNYILSIASLSLYLCISLYSARSKVHRMGGRRCVSMVLMHCLPVNTLYIPGHVVDHECNTPVESYVVHSPSIGIEVGSHLQRKISYVLNPP
jgi:hypothetical protein